MLKQQKIFFDFLRFCIGSAKEIPDSLKEADWKELYAIAKKQCLVGVLFDGIKKLPAEHVGIEKELLLQWMAESQMLEKANVRLNDAAIQVSEWFRKKGFRTCILKGQGNALMYPNPYSRTPGDIDIWVEGGDKRVISFVRSISPHEKACYHHIEFPSYKGVEVEVHYRPSFLLCFWHNRKLQKYYERVKEEQFSHRVMLGEQGEIAIPTVEFNIIFQLTHIFSHLMNEGIGLRQLVDYYYVLCDFYKVYQNFSKTHPSSLTLKEGDFSNHPVPLSKEGSTFSPSPSSSGSGDVTAPSRCSEPLRSKVGGPSKVSPNCAGWDRRDAIGDMTSATASTSTDTSATAARSSFAANSSAAIDRVQKELKELGLWKFAGGIMYIMQEVFGMPASRLIVPPNEKYGRFVLNEVLEAGNFGRHDARNRFGRSQLGHNLQRVYRDIRLVRYFPAEALCEPLFRIWHFFWRLKHRRQSLGVFS
ncbi:nucleotidyltransferase domain-containing protein [Segatella copri]|uniref:Tat pathway signal sequence domain protein n=1 Tax=Segatella copri DSM 18205 TaxID=537011 RepID=D1PHS2_9BACT|nr:nucleotidyltransferase family protein [Segatella copri]EFB33751.1 Tat pathway signal sequence domain protein [Segatella copri DSM 18205]MCW4096610.1 nucleotidyltransferase family protein [Segatella copri]MQP18854.1 nucleotidyltransferase family protein [Segatella copri DSM 18205]UEA43877.1 nucleotidyltransferase family protein [Segatella copri DSM 18205]UWP51509.1 nucleotidyltransferase family protein [Segatella copri DSM 18205]